MGTNTRELGELISFINACISFNKKCNVINKKLPLVTLEKIVEDVQDYGPIKPNTDLPYETIGMDTGSGILFGQNQRIQMIDASVSTFNNKQTGNWIPINAIKKGQIVHVNVVKDPGDSDAYTPEFFNSEVLVVEKSKGILKGLFDDGRLKLLDNIHVVYDEKTQSSSLVCPKKDMVNENKHQYSWQDVKRIIGRNLKTAVPNYK